MRLTFRRINRLFSALLPRGSAHPKKISRNSFREIFCTDRMPNIFPPILLRPSRHDVRNVCRWVQKSLNSTLPRKKQEKHDESLRHRRKSQLPQGYSINQALVYINQALNYINQTLNYINQTLVYRFPLSQLTFSLTF